MTKKIVTTFLTISFFILAKGQITKKSILLGGQINYYSGKTDYSGTGEVKRSQKSYEVSIGKAFKENVIYGFITSYNPYNSSYYTDTYPNYYFSKSDLYSIGLFRRDYEKLAKDFYFFIEAGIVYSYQKSSDSDSTGKVTRIGITSQGKLYLTPGLSYRIYKKLHLEIIIPDILTVNYINSNYETLNSYWKNKSLLINSNLNSRSLNFLGVGFHFIL